MKYVGKIKVKLEEVKIESFSLECVPQSSGSLEGAVRMELPSN